MKSLKVIQVISKVLWIISKVMFVLCIIGAAGSLLGLILVASLQNVVLWEDVTLAYFLEDKGTNVTTAIVGCIVGIIVCGAGIAVAKLNEIFFKKELDKGTPFDKEIVKDMRILGFIHVGNALVIGSIVGLMLFIISKTNPNYIDVTNEGWSTFWFGAVLLLVSLFCDYGAEKEHPEAVDVKDVKSSEVKEEETK